MTYRKLVIAGCLTMFSAFASIPMAFLVLNRQSLSNSEEIAFELTVQIVGILLFAGITLFTKMFLNSLFYFHYTDKNIALMLMANISAGLFVIVGLLFPEAKETTGVAALVLMVFQGIVQIRFGYLLQKLPSSLGGMLRSFCYLNMATGICVASILLILPGVVVSAISDLMLATIFFNTAKQVKVIENRKST